jgi:hypothetical protein
MSLHVPELPLQIDPLIAEARRRARRRRLYVLGALVVVAAAASSPLRAALAGASANAAVSSSGRQCTPETTYGAQCMDVGGSGLKVTEIQTWFDNTGVFWPSDRWRIDLERYNCDPVGRTKSTCWIAATWHGRVQRGARVVGRVVQPAHFAQSQSNGFWPTFSLPHTFGSNVWLCTEVSVWNGSAHKWVYNGGGLAHGLRACVSVHR